MNRATSLLAKGLIGATLALVAMCGQAAAQGFSTAPARYTHFSRGVAVPSFGFPSYGFPAFASPFFGFSQLPPPRPYMPKYWWTGAYPTADPRQAGYNPQAGYRWGDVATLILGTYPKQADIILDGNAIGSAGDLGPIQLPFGTHTLRVESPGYEPSETVLKVESPSFQRLQINLRAVAPSSASIP